MVHEHTKDFPFVCQYCSKGFLKEYDMTNHIDKEHLKEVKHICEDCGKGFTNKYEYRSHKWRHDNKGRYQCPSCDKKYNNRKNLIQHFRKFHPDQSLDLVLGKATFNLVDNDKGPVSFLQKQQDQA